MRHNQNEIVLQAAAAAAGRLVGGYTVVYEGVLGPWSLPGFLEATGLNSLHYAMLLPSMPLETCTGISPARTSTLGMSFRSVAAPEFVSSTLFEMVRDGSLIRARETPDAASD